VLVISHHSDIIGVKVGVNVDLANVDNGLAICTVSRRYSNRQTDRTIASHLARTGVKRETDIERREKSRWFL